MFKKLQINQLFVIASLFFGIKTYVIYRFLFNINLENMMQETILFINPFVSAFFMFALSIWFKKKNQVKYIKVIAILGSVILYLNLMFYRNFGDFLTIPILFQGSNAKDLGSSVLNLIEWYDVLLFLDLAAIFYLAKPNVSFTQVTATMRPKRKKFVLSLSVVFLLGNYVLAEIERPQLLQRGFDREYLVKNIGLFNFHLYDIVQQSRSKAQRVLADGNELSEIITYIDEEATDTSETDTFGIAKDKNVIFVWLESLQTFVINNELHGEEVTPFLNDLIDDSYYFENFYHQTEQGKTSDSEFITETSLYPLPSGAVYFTHSENTYQSLPDLLGEAGYNSSVFHANNSSFWNRNVMYDNLGIDHFYDVEAYNVTDANQVGWGLKDKDFFKQSMKYLTSLEEPYYTRMITLTNHHPFTLDEEDATLAPYDSNSKTLNHYFQTVRYLDESLELFFEELKASGEYEDSVIVLMGDHYGISDFHDRSTARYLEKEEITPYDHIQLQRVPMYIHIPGEEGQVISDIAGQIDIKPTLLHLLGIDGSNEIGFGTNLFGENRKEFITLRDGSFIGDDVIYTKDSFYDRSTGEVVETTDALLELKERAQQELTYSDQLIYGDLLRFHDLNK
ncbi:Phosphoglycerol transferase MdoB [Halolactibacillus halophilus]|uniref:Lipoteichoic acid synthase-like YqgS n=1 Tax=Halolactibacillus halophilus TaxID=306540 RepID=A0A1I5KS12_9BACI|nr:LTA synthase family protein [Halolactibacillus halophilus]GEM00480.1 lipoteichoic acid synthase-like YqgS [Halolactibacillus halophilus]SFO87805.1 Phosphoglycerol transferase MdoB [Halolactibacillus halophilus]